MPFVMQAISLLPWLTTLPMLILTTTANTSIAKPGCPSRCGNITIPYPFGIGLNGSCSLTNPYNINCNTSYNPPKPFLGKTNLQVMDISDTQIRIRIAYAGICYQNGEVVNSTSYTGIAWMRVNSLPFVFSDTANKFTAVGCDDVSAILATGILGRSFTSGCASVCSKPQEALNGSCSGTGCCQTSIPKGLKGFYINTTSLNKHANKSFNPCSYAFLAEQDKFTFNVADLTDPKFIERTLNNTPVVLEWTVGVNQTCAQAQGNKSTYACKQNTKCTDFDVATEGYRCSCLPGYQGNPYLSPGCTDVDECATPNNQCSHVCTNTPGSYTCSCPQGHHGDGLKNGTGCYTRNNSSLFVLKFCLGMSFGFLSLLLLGSWIYFTIKRKKLMKMREEFFQQNGGLILNQKLSQSKAVMASPEIFSADELKAATNSYSEDRILGKGGYGTVYRGTLKHGRDVAIKKSRVADAAQVEQFINEVLVLTQINHRNVVKLLGCCLETEVPLLVYEFISNGTLFEHIHMHKFGTSWLTWANCVRLATEIADALAYLHSAAAIPIIHRDIKSTNILLDEGYTAKISDFGASRLIPIDQTQVTTLVQGTLGYLDPEYLHTSQLTDKSDVYSFGVVLAELLTKEKPLCLERKMEERNLATYFVLAVKEDRLMEILDPQLVKEASKEQLVTMAKLIKDCLNVERLNRPTMKEVALELQKLNKQNRDPLAKQFYKHENESINQDLYPVPSTCQNDNASTSQFSGDYNSMQLVQLDIISEMNYPR